MDIANLMQQASEMQAQMKEIQAQLANKTISGSAGGSMVTVTVNGKKEVLSVDIKEPLLSADEKELLQDLVITATNEALRKAQELSEQEMKKLTGGFNIPGLSNLF